ncbi:BTB/POZ domain-containing protein KCTD14 [Brachionichthys hirsutus]|uniref:BTB/POZ domain-containing protein KCTD14 n=1 Tax=Brachionichthys hirsutus TaxID=412623 RepID=UPI003604C501
MSLQDPESPETPSAASPVPPVVHLNVGGHLFTTSLGTLRRHPGSALSRMFGGQTQLPRDAQGRHFIDRDGGHFRAVLDFLRSDWLPKEHILEVHKEALFYDIKPLVKLLEETPQMFGELVGRQQFLSRVPHYRENIEVLIHIARAEAIAARHSTVVVCVLQTEEDLGLYENAISSLEADKESVVTFGPWRAALSTKDLLDCVQMDIESQGYRVSIKPHAADKGFLSRSYSCFYKLTFTWW